MHDQPPLIGHVVAVAKSAAHSFSKICVDRITLIQGLGVEGDAHKGVWVQHLARIKKDPTQPNLRQVHLIHQELFDELATQGFAVEPGQLGENVTTQGIPLLALPQRSILAVGPDVRLEVTGLRNPCAQIDGLQKGLLAAVLGKGPNGEVIRKTGVMAIVLAGGTIAPGDAIHVELPPEPHDPLQPV